MMNYTDNRRPACRLRAGQTSRDCPRGTAGHNEDGRLDVGDLISTEAGRAIYHRAIGAKYDATEAGKSVDEANAAMHAILDPAIAELNGDDRHDCGCGECTGHGSQIDFSSVLGTRKDSTMTRKKGIDLTQAASDPNGTDEQAAMARLRSDSATAWNRPSTRVASPPSATTIRDDDDTSEEAAKAALRQRNAEAFKRGK